MQDILHKLIIKISSSRLNFIDPAQGELLKVVIKQSMYSSKMICFIIPKKYDWVNFPLGSIKYLSIHLSIYLNISSKA